MVMTTETNELTAHVENTPETVLGFIADVRNRLRYLPSLKAVTDIQGGPAGAGTTWKWQFMLLGKLFEGVGRSLKYEPGRLYSFRTEGGLESTWTYRAEPEGRGTKLTVRAEYRLPDELQAHLPPAPLVDALKKAEAELVLLNLRAMLER
jgi:carbon monoxide dehydrogenase subunit G